MRPNIDFEECLKDSPRFRASLEDAENDVDVLEAKVEKLMKLCGGMIEAGKQFNTANSAFIIGLRELSTYFKDDELASDDNAVAEALEKFTRVLTELQKYHNILLDQAHRSICKNLNNFIKNDIKRVKDTRKHFEKISDDMDSALVKNSQALRSKPQECEDANNVLTAMKRCFAHNSLDYVFQINVLHSKKRFDILDTMLAFMHAQSTYFHQGFDLFEDLDPFVKQVANRLHDLSVKADARRKEMEERHALVQGKEVAIYATPTELDVQFSENNRRGGYLFKRTSNAFKTWVRRWFSIENNQLVYRKRSKDTLTIMEEDLRLCNVKPILDSDRRYCFEVLSPSRSHTLQADSEQECQDWVTLIQDSVSSAYNDRHPSLTDPQLQKSQSASTLQDSSSSDSRSTNSAEAVLVGAEVKEKPLPQNKQLNRMQQILAVPGNDLCCDCSTPEPRWSSINLGISLCIECSGIHRGLGVHVSKVRSMTLDAWEQEQLKVMLELGNDAVNQIYLADLIGTEVKATPHCSRELREKWIRKKYVEKAYLKSLPTSDEVMSPIKRWTVSRIKRRSPLRTVSSPVKSSQSQDKPVPQEDSESTPETLVFGARRSYPQPKTSSGEEAAAIAVPESVDSDGSVSDSDGEASEDAKSITSIEDLSQLTPDLLLYKATQARNLAVMREALAHGANPNWHNPAQGGRTPLIVGIEGGSMATVEFLLVNGSKVDHKDDHARSPLHHATLLGHTGQVCQLLKRNANQHAIDMDGKDPLKIAVDNANADIVTLLRLAKLNEEMQETEGISGHGDETFNEVFRDFTNMANNAPEKLNRSSKK